MRWGPAMVEVIGGVVDLKSRLVHLGSKEASLSTVEADLLGYLVEAAGRAIPRGELLQEVWGYHPSVVSRTVDTTILRIRRKVERDPSKPFHIRTVPGFGYLFHAVPEPATSPHVFNVPMVGRDQEIQRLEDLRAQGVRWVTIVGPIGIGKTRFALACSAGKLVNVSMCDTAEMVVQRVAEVHGVEAVDAADLMAKLADVEMVVLDGLRHHIPSAKVFVSTVSNGTTCWLATATGPIGFGGEVKLELPPLTSEQSLELASVLHAAPVTPETLSEVLTHTDGIPLAIEQAVEQMLLFGRTPPAEVQWDRVVSRVASAWLGLSRGTRQSLATLCLFDGSFSVSLGEATLRSDRGGFTMLSRLREQGWLVLRDPEGRRLAMLGPIRSAIREIAAPEADIRRNFVRAIVEASRSPDRRERPEPAHVVVATRISIEHGDRDSAVEFLQLLSFRRQTGEISAQLGVLLSDAREAFGQDAALLLTEAEVVRTDGRTQEALHLCRHAASLSDDEEITCRAMQTEGLLLMAQGQLDDAVAAFRQALLLAKLHELPRLEAMASFSLGIVYLDRSKIREGVEQLTRSVEVYGETNVPRLEAQSLDYLGAGFALWGRPIDAEASLHAALTIAQSCGESRIQIRVLNNLALVAHDEGALDEAARWVAEAAALSSDDRGNSGHTAYVAALVAAARGDDNAIDLANKALELCRRYGPTGTEMMVRALLHEQWFTQRGRPASAELLDIETKLTEMGFPYDALAVRARRAWIELGQDPTAADQILAAFSTLEEESGGLPCALGWHRRRLLAARSVEEHGSHD